MAEEQKASASFRITYFPAGGRAAALRLAAAIGGIAFEDEFISFDQLKEKRDKNEIKWRGVPELVIYGKNNKKLKIGQSNACLRFIGRLANNHLYPSQNSVLCALIDEVLDSSEDMLAIFGYAGRTTDEEKKAFREGLYAKDGLLTYWLNKFEQRLEENEKRGNKAGYIVGNELTIADLKLAINLYGLTLGFFDYIPKDIYTKCGYKRLPVYLKFITSNKVIADFMTNFKKRCDDFKEGKGEVVVTYPGKVILSDL